MEIIKVDKISKLYQLGGSASNSLRDAVVNRFKSIGSSNDKRELWALRDVSFSVDDGERVGIIGGNGAGKSTLLKILSRITKPTAGLAEIRGRVGSLLEVGTGFHNELTGRENIFLNGAILGMRRSEIEKKFDEIVTFSEIEKFLDTPVKYYSSGMYMRLAFSVAAHLEPEVLIVDEVLAVGDIAFQKKSLSKMRDVGESGRTVIFVSHDMQAITRLCERAIWVNAGEVVSDGPAQEIVADYLSEQSKTGGERSWNDAAEAPGNEVARLRNVRVIDASRKANSSPSISEKIGVEMTYNVIESGRILIPNFHFYNDQGVCVFISHDWYSGWRDTPKEVGTYTSTMWIPADFLSEGAHFVTVALSSYKPLNVHFVERDAVTFNVTDSLSGDNARGDYAGVLPGTVRPILDWETSRS